MANFMSKAIKNEGVPGTRNNELGLSLTETRQIGRGRDLRANLHIRRVIINLCCKSPQLQWGVRTDPAHESRMPK